MTMRTTLGCYLLPDKINQAFGPYKGVRLAQQAKGRPGKSYVAHVDPGKTEANYAISIGHLDWEGGLPHVVVDNIHAWKPTDFPGGTIDYPHVERELLRLVADFPLSIMVFDQFNSIGTIQKLQAQAHALAMDWRPNIYERPASSGLNWKSAEVFKKALHLGLVHAPPHDLAQAELEHLIVVGQKVSAPTSGEVQTDDLADCLIGLTYTLLQEHLDVFNDLSRFKPTASLPGGLPLRMLEASDPISQLRALTAGQADRRNRHYNPARGIRRYR